MDAMCQTRAGKESGMRHYYDDYAECDCDNCKCIGDFCMLVDSMVKDILHLESEVIRVRYQLSQYLPHPFDKRLRDDILSDLSGSYYDHDAYGEFVKLAHGGKDPMEAREWNSHVRELVSGRESYKY